MDDQQFFARCGDAANEDLPLALDSALQSATAFRVLNNTANSHVISEHGRDVWAKWLELPQSWRR
jgi:hypothetical protein